MQALDRRLAAELPEHRAECVLPRELVVAVRRKYERRHRRHPADEHPEHVERSLVRPVKILEHECRRSPCQLAQKRSRDLVRLRALFDERLHLAAGLRRRRPRTGPSGRGVNSGSHAPHMNLGCAPCRARNVRSSDVLPMPASPTISTARPPAVPRAASSAVSESRAAERSRSPSLRSTSRSIPVSCMSSNHHRSMSPVPSTSESARAAEGFRRPRRDRRLGAAAATVRRRRGARHEQRDGPKASERRRRDRRAPLGPGPGRDPRLAGRRVARRRRAQLRMGGRGRPGQAALVRADERRTAR